MSLSKQHLSGHTSGLRFDVDELGRNLQAACPEARFAFLLGSARAGRVDVGSDVDLAFYLDGRPGLELHERICAEVAKLAPGAFCDVGFLRNAEPVYRFEALKGRLLFARDLQLYVDFFSRTCREYEAQLFDYERQLRYRREAA